LAIGAVTTKLKPRSFTTKPGRFCAIYDCKKVCEMQGLIDLSYLDSHTLSNTKCNENAGFSGLSAVFTPLRVKILTIKYNATPLPTTSLNPARQLQD
jgi:hypothetical protein